MAKKNEGLACLSPGCQAEYYSKGFCGYHYRQFRRDWLNADGTPTALFRDCSKIRCEGEGCEVMISRQGRPDARFCKTHYNYIRHGIMDGNGKLLKAPKLRTGKKCRVEGCDSGTSRSNKEQLCLTHFTEQSEGRTLKFKGCKVCKAPVRLIRGFCTTHYANFKFGIIDLEGLQIRDKIRRARYAEKDQCRVQSCKVRPSAHFMCERHRKQWRNGDIDDRGTPLRKLPSYNRNQRCKHKNCQEPAYCKLLCKSHYGKLLRGFLYVPPPMNQQPCKVDKCKELGHAKGMCVSHYRKMNYMLNRKTILAEKRATHNERYARRKAARAKVLSEVQSDESRRRSEESGSGCSERPTACHPNPPRMVEAV